jgi:hypothetical protein
MVCIRRTFRSRDCSNHGTELRHLSCTLPPPGAALRFVMLNLLARIIENVIGALQQPSLNCDRPEWQLHLQACAREMHRNAS